MNYKDTTYKMALNKMFSIALFDEFKEDFINHVGTMLIISFRKRLNNLIAVCL